MAKELPYYRFTVSQWLNDDISLEDYATKGVFIDVCAFYWFKDCNITKALLEKRFKDASTELNLLYDLGIIKVISEGGMKNNQRGGMKKVQGGVVKINFLDEQYEKLSKKHENRVIAGRSGGYKKASNARILVQQKSSYKDKDKDKDKDNIKNYTNSFMSELSDSDFSDPKLKLYFKTAKAFHTLFVKNLEELNITSTDLSKANGKWINHIRLMMEKDKRTQIEIREVFNFLQVDDFWRTNIRSTSKLREKFEELLIKSRANGKNRPNNAKRNHDIGEVANILESEFADFAD